MGSAIANLLGLLDAFVAGGIGSMADKFLPLGWKFFGLAMLITLMNAFYQFWIKGGAQEMVASLVKLAIISSIPITLLSNWVPLNNTFTGFFQKELPAVIGVNGSTPSQVIGNQIGVIMKSVDAISQPTTEGTASPASLTQLKAANARLATETQSWRATMASKSAAVTAAKATGNQAAIQQAQAALDASKVEPQSRIDAQAAVDAANAAVEYSKAASSSGGAFSLDVVSMLGKAFAQILFTIVIFICSILLVFASIFSVYMPLAGMALGVVFGPLLVAWLPLESMRSMTEKWFGFMLGNGMSFVVAVAIFSALGATLTSMSAELGMVASDSAWGGFWGVLVTLAGILAVYLFSANLMLKANEIAQGMTGGSTVGEGLFGNLAAMGAAKASGASTKTGGALGAALASKGVIGGAGSATSTASKGVSSAMSGAGKALQSLGAKTGSSALANAGKSLANKSATVAEAGAKAGAAMKSAGSAGAKGSLNIAKHAAGIQDIKKQSRDV